VIFDKRSVKFKSEYALLAVVILAASSMIIINFFTIRTLSAVRAYSDGESRYSKGQKDAARNLIMFVNTGEIKYWDSFQEELSVPIGDSLARVGLLQHQPDSVIRKGFLAGRNHPDDIDDLIWLFRNFKDVSFMKKAIALWKQGDYLVGQEAHAGHSAKQKVDVGNLLPDEKSDLIETINRITTGLTIKERAFQAALGEASRVIKNILLLANVILTVLVIGSTFLYARSVFRRLEKKNSDLTTTNEELDKFVYSASHDLRSPITSLHGLVGLAKDEKNPEVLSKYLLMMQQSLDKQDSFLRDLIDFTRNKRAKVIIKDIDLISLIDDVVEQHSFNDDARDIDIRKELKAKTMKADEFRLKVVLNNLLSNAIKYSDPKKEERLITIRTHRQNGSMIFQIEDNGIGIKKEDHGKIFEMFFAGDHHKRGSGLGLFITHETVQKLNGTITVNSQPGIGTMFTIELPHGEK
jgi:signal transduction histidine kinase